MLDEDGRPRHPVPGLELAPVVAGGVGGGAVVERGPARVKERRLVGRAVRPLQGPEAQRLDLVRPDDPHRDELHLRVVEGVAVVEAVLGVEALDDAPDVADPEPALRDLRAQLEPLPVVAALRDPLEALALGRHPVVLEVAPAVRDELLDKRVQPLDGRLVDVRQGRDERAHVLVLHVGLEEPHRRRDPGRDGDEHVARRDGLGERHPVERPRPAEGDEGELPGVHPSRHRVRADREGHVGVDDPDDAEGRVGDGQAELLPDLLLDGAARAVGIDGEVAPQHLVRVEPPEGDLGVGDGGLVAALAVAGGAGVRPRRARPHVEPARRVDVGDGPAPRADGHEVDHRDEDRVPAHVGVARVHDLDAPVGDGADVGRGAADVDGDDVLRPREEPFRPAADDPARRPRHEDVDRALRARLDRRHPAVRLDEAKVRAKPLARELVPEVGEVDARFRPDERVHRGGREALVLAEHVRDVRRAADVGLRHLALDDGAGALLVLVVHEREEEADDDGADPPLLEDADRFEHVVLVERGPDPPVRGEDPLGDGDPVPALDEGPRLPRHVEVEREVVRALVAGDVEDVPEVPGGEHPHLRAGVLDGDVGRDGGAVDHEVDVLAGDPRDLAELEEALQHPDGLVLGGALDLVHEHPALGLEHEVRVRAPDVDSYPCAHRVLVVLAAVPAALPVTGRAAHRRHRYRHHHRRRRPPGLRRARPFAGSPALPRSTPHPSSSSAASTSSGCSAGTTFPYTRAMRPSGSMR